LNHSKHFPKGWNPITTFTTFHLESIRQVRVLHRYNKQLFLISIVILAGDNGMGESMDYMAPTVDSQKPNKDVSWGQDKAQFSVPALFVASILLPGATLVIFRSASFE
jgi:hypothetical protein